jgi:hypothetical protein
MGLRWLDSTTLAVQPSDMADDEGSNDLNEEICGSFGFSTDLADWDNRSCQSLFGVPAKT